MTEAKPKPTPPRQPDGGTPTPADEPKAGTNGGTPMPADEPKK